jgi:hypothetical protein
MGRRNRAVTILAALVVALLALPALASASGEDVIRDCYDDGHIDGSYSQEEYQDAQDNIPGDVDQYSDCRDVIAQAQADRSRSGGGSNGSGSGGGSGSSGGGSASGGGSGVAGATRGSSGDRRGGSPRPHGGNPNLETKSGAYASTEADKAAYEAAKARAAQGGDAGGLAIPAAGDFSPAQANTLPLPVVLALAALGLLVAATSALVARKRLPALNRVVPSRFRRS